MPFIVLVHLNLMYLMLNKKTVIYLVHIQGMSESFDRTETVKTLFYLSCGYTGSNKNVKLSFVLNEVCIKLRIIYIEW